MQQGQQRGLPLVQQRGQQQQQHPLLVQQEQQQQPPPHYLSHHHPPVPPPLPQQQPPPLHLQPQETKIPFPQQPLQVPFQIQGQPFQPPPFLPSSWPASGDLRPAEMKSCTLDDFPSYTFLMKLYYLIVHRPIYSLFQHPVSSPSSLS